MTLRIGIVAHAELGGSGSVATDLAVGLAERGHEVHLITPKDPFRLSANSGVEVHEVHATSHPMWEAAPWTLALASRIADVAEEHALDVIHVHFAVPYAAATELACQMMASPPPWVLTLHGSDVSPMGTDGSYARVVAHALRRASRLTVPSAHLRDEVLALGQSPRIDVISNFVDSERFRPSPGRRDGLDAPLLVHASNFRPVKRVHDVAEVFARVAAQTNARLLLLGDGPDRAGVLEMLDRRGLGARVEAPGAERDIERWLRRGHVALLPSERESFGLAALEALACGVPVVATRVGGLPEVVAHERNGLLFDVGDVVQMAAAVLHLLSTPVEWERMAAEARTDAVARFAPADALRAYEAVYAAACGDDPPRLSTPPPRLAHDT